MALSPSKIINNNCIIGKKAVSLQQKLERLIKIYNGERRKS